MSSMQFVNAEPNLDQLKDQAETLRENGYDRACLLTYNARTDFSDIKFLVCTDPDGEWFWLQSDDGQWDEVNKQPLDQLVWSSVGYYSLIGA